MNSKEKARGNSKGFTLLEIMIAMAMAMAFIAPSAYWFSKSRSNQAAFRKFIVCHELELEMQEAQVLQDEKSRSRKLNWPLPATLTIEAKKTGSEIRLHGWVSDNSKRELCTLEGVFFHP